MCIRDRHEGEGHKYGIPLILYWMNRLLYRLFEENREVCRRVVEKCGTSYPNLDQCKRLMTTPLPGGRGPADKHSNVWDVVGPNTYFRTSSVTKSRPGSTTPSSLARSVRVESR